ncbi:helix-turn-helix domain-containing protein [Clostridium formicaceticum]|uniref:Helix-turn-helix domain protein n=1 Tax=Clostridium formicaceticum TaxID=1497 RepID=A0AAC9RPW8_9CLOT|nr:helix-turn-helix domain-containing protein [Clostridium formicaceticum]AOY74718.1 hypothetical protein BJL90_01365 [Clostridium formicaceticum]ARE89103.1 Helix-turn-helix domain protein [Clostridium formicaceticum]
MSINTVSKTISYETIVKATQGDTHSIDQIIGFYTPYMQALATVEYVGDNGKIYFAVDEEMLGRMRAKLMKRVMKFKPVPYQRKEKERCRC